MTLCNCGHPRDDHRQHDDGVYCYGCMGECTGQEKTAAVATVHLSAGVTPEGLAEETVSGYVNEAAERLRATIHRFGVQTPSQADSVIEALDAALATERRNTVERIRERLPMFTGPNQRYLAAILDEVAS